MVEQARQKPTQLSANPLERWTLFGSILIWTGVIMFAIGLLVALRNRHNERLAYASLPIETPTPTSTPLPTGTKPVFPAGWSTATPTPKESTASRDSRDAKLSADALTAEAISTAVAVREPDSKARSQAPTSTSLPSPEPPDRLVIPQIDLESSVVPIGWETVEQQGQTTRVWQVVDEIVGWHKTSAYPGRPGNVVLNGHHNIKGEVFRYLVDLEKGDHIQVYAKDKSYTYAVSEKHILKEKGEPLAVRRENARWIAPTEDERLTLITCWPYTNNTHRLVVVAKPVAPRTIDGLHQ